MGLRGLIQNYVGFAKACVNSEVALVGFVLAQKA